LHSCVVSSRLAYTRHTHTSPAGAPTRAQPSHGPPEPGSRGRPLHGGLLPDLLEACRGAAALFGAHAACRDGALRVGVNGARRCVKGLSRGGTATTPLVTGGVPSAVHCHQSSDSPMAKQHANLQRARSDTGEHAAGRTRTQQGVTPATQPGSRAQPARPRRLGGGGHGGTACEAGGHRGDGRTGEMRGSSWVKWRHCCKCVRAGRPDSNNFVSSRVCELYVQQQNVAAAGFDTATVKKESGKGEAANHRSQGSHVSVAGRMSLRDTRASASINLL
jgi:hypothetical protein